MAEYTPVALLPTEIISMILVNNSCREIINFASTCKHFHLLIFNNQHLWRYKCKQMLPKYSYELIKKNEESQWLKELKYFYSVKHEVCTELLMMSSKYYWRANGMSLNDVKNFFELALSHSMNYCYVVFILHDVVKTGNHFIDMNCSKLPYTLTEIYYAKIALRYLVQTFLAIKWVQDFKSSDFHPACVVNFFMQWTVAHNTYLEEDIETLVKAVAKDVEKMFLNDGTQPKCTLPQKISKGLIKPREVISAITEVIYSQMKVTQIANLDNIDMIKAFNTKCGHVIAVAAVYQSVARKCGLPCDVPCQPIIEYHSFPRCLCVEVVERQTLEQSRVLVYKIETKTGAITVKTHYPNAVYRVRKRYCPYRFMVAILRTIRRADVKKWHKPDVENLEGFLDRSVDYDGPYKNYRNYLTQDDLASAMLTPLKQEFLEDCHIKIINHLVSITQCRPPRDREPTENCRGRGMLYAVGMVCYHQRLGYACVIRGWTLECPAEFRRHRLERDRLLNGYEQPFYRVIAADLSERYIAQENIADVKCPSRLQNVEDVIGKEFIRFDGFCYIPNLEKNQEYPEDGAIREMYKTRFELRFHLQLSQQHRGIEPD